MLTSNQRDDFPFEPMMLALGTRLHKEQVRWRNAATRRLNRHASRPMGNILWPDGGGRGASAGHDPVRRLARHRQSEVFESARRLLPNESTASAAAGMLKRHHLGQRIDSILNGTVG